MDKPQYKQLELFPDDAIEGDGHQLPWRLKFGVIDGGQADTASDDGDTEQGNEAA